MVTSSKSTHMGAKHSPAYSSAYQPLHQGEELGDHETQDGTGMAASFAASRPGPEHRFFRVATCGLTVCLVLLVGCNLFFYPQKAFPHHSSCPCSTHKVPQYFQTSPELWPGPTATGRPAFLAQTRTLDPTLTYVPNEPLQTSYPVQGMGQANQSIFKMMGHLSPYSPSPGFGVDEYPLPAGADIIQVQMLSRHGSRYPTTGSTVEALGKRLASLSDSFNPKGPLAFLKDWKYQLGSEILVPNGRQELFESGILHNYMYGALYNPTSKIIVRTTTQDRMLKSAENWLAGFFGLDWTNNATIEVIIEERGFNNSLAGSLNCPNSWTKSSGEEARNHWVRSYLANATTRFQAMTEGFAWTADDVYAAQTMCPYETVAYGSSRFCDLFTYDEWQGFGYSIDLFFAAISAFNSPVGRATGIGYQQEVVARLKNHTLGYSGSQINVTLDSNPETFPLNQSLYFDFSHDTNIVSILTAFGLRQFAEELPATRYAGKHNLTIAHVTPFGARLDIEVIKTPKPLSPNRDGYLRGEETRYIHFILNQRTLPLGQSFPECDASRRDGWCDLDTFLKVQEDMPSRAKFDDACFGDYPAVSYGEVTDGPPP
ncbi:3-phytase A precursor [Ophiocordyceps sinensis CO18]|uniref:3-phytase n=1 Tax=Ophiocordyceps sinensis (strain Co18 / CGMCC 3.14243) TaxID=911162 RepID=T5A9R4_OPHSC|nr:3-phytase A precursor [Ophiocordyceps sinensis CO18]